MSVSPELMAAAAKAGMPGVTAPEVPEDVDDNAIQPDTLDTSNPEDKGAQPKPPESEGDTDLSKFPEDYFGADVKAYAEEHGVEAAETYFKALQDANRVANRRLQEIATLRKTAEEEAAKAAAQKRVTDTIEPEPLEEISDEDLLEKYGFDPSILQYDEGKAILQMVKNQAELESKLTGITSQQENQAWENQFFGTLDTLQKEHGSILAEDGTPVSKQDLEEYAIEINTFDPTALYWRIMGPVLANRPAPEAKPRRDLKREIGGTRRRGAAKGSVAPTPPKTLAEHLAAAKESLDIKGDPFSQ